MLHFLLALLLLIANASARSNKEWPCDHILRPCDYLLKLLQSLDPSDDVVDDFFGEGFFYGGVFCGHACGAMLE